MKLKREAVKDSEVKKGIWNFCIYDKDAEKLELVEAKLRNTQCPFTVGGENVTWGKYCDNCPSYEDGYGAGFWIPAEEVEEFKKAFKLAKSK